jgi:hypothetical protein
MDLIRKILSIILGISFPATLFFAFSLLIFVSLTDNYSTDIIGVLVRWSFFGTVFFGGGLFASGISVLAIDILKYVR